MGHYLLLLSVKKVMINHQFVSTYQNRASRLLFYPVIIMQRAYILGEIDTRDIIGSSYP